MTGQSDKNGRDQVGHNADGDEGIARRRFLKLAATAAAAGGIAPSKVLAKEATPVRVLQSPMQQQDLAPLGNGEAPALQFQAYPGGTGALYQHLADEGINPFERHEITIDPWPGAMPTDEADLAFLPVHRLSALVRDGHISSVDLTEVYLDRLKRYDPVLLCAVTILEDRAREEAQQADMDLRNGTWHGPLHGIPYGIKDLFAISGAPTTWGSADFQDRRLDFDSEIARRLRRSGAVLIAKLATGEFARGDQWYRGRTKNPWNTEQGSSGSSAGPGSATAAACVAFAIGTETQGSIVSPARRNGISALRPTFGRVSRYGGMVLSWSMDKVGPMCRTIEDCALVFNEMHGADEKDPGSLTMPFHFERDLNLASLNIGFTEDAPEAFVQRLRELGANPRAMEALPQGGSNALGVESSAAFDFYVSQQPEPEPVPEGGRPGRFRGGRETLALDYVQAQRRRLLLMGEVQEAMNGWDMFLSGSGQVGLTNQTGHPAVIVPYDFGGEDHQQPICTTIVGNLFTDDKILGVAHAYQASTDWHMRRPNLV